MAKKVYKIQGMDCDACAKMIEMDFEDAGITASCNYPKETLEIEFNEKLNDSLVKEIIKKSGYSIV